MRGIYAPQIDRMYKILIPIVGQTFNRLTILKEYDIRKNKKLIHMCECLCQCGTICQIAKDKIISNHTKSCGCQKKESSSRNITTFNKKRRGKPTFKCKNNNEHRFYYIYKNIRSQSVWTNYDDFFNDMFESYEQHINKFGIAQTGLHLLENETIYSLHTCKWMTRTEMSKFRKDAILAHINGQKFSITELEETYNIHNRQFLYAMIKKYNDNELLDKILTYKKMNDIQDIQKFCYDIDIKLKKGINLIFKGYSFEDIANYRKLMYENVYFDEYNTTLETLAIKHNIPTYVLRKRLLYGMPLSNALKIKKPKCSYDIFDYREDLFFSLWKSMISRTKRGYASFNNQHGLYEKWKNYYAFKEYAYAMYIDYISNGNRLSDIEIDRIDNNKRYEPHNIRFADKSTQMNNTSKTIKVKDEPMTLLMKQNNIKINSYTLQCVKKIIKNKNLDALKTFNNRFVEIEYKNKNITLLEFAKTINRKLEDVMNCYFLFGMFPEEIEWHLKRKHNSK